MIEFQAGRCRTARMVVLGVAIVILTIVSMMKQGMTGPGIFFLPLRRGPSPDPSQSLLSSTVCEDAFVRIDSWNSVKWKIGR